MYRLVAILLAASATPLAAQACLHDRSLRVDTLQTTIGLRVSRDELSGLDSYATATIGEAVGMRFAPSPMLSRLFYPGTTIASDSNVVRPYHRRFARFDLALDAAGQVEHLDVIEPSEDPVTDATLEQDLRAAAADGAFTRLVDGAARHYRVDLVADTSQGGIHPLLRLRVPITRIDRPVEIVSAPMPIYPRALRSRRMDGLVRLRFVVSETGRTETSSIRLVTVSDSGFIASAVKAVSEVRYRPALAGGCPVKVMVEQNIRYTLHR